MLLQVAVNAKFPTPKSVTSGTESRRTYDVEYVRSLFDRIAPRYDFLNHLLSSGIDIFWRRKAVSLLRGHRPRTILDVATGTGDLAFEACRLAPDAVVGIDVAPAMLDLARRKAEKRSLSTLVSFADAKAEDLPFATNSFDAVTVGFGVRNFTNLEQGLKEMVRVMRPGGAMVVLEFSRPGSPLMAALYGFYSRRILPLIGGSISNREAYEYLPSTIQEFPDAGGFEAILGQAGLQEIRSFPLTFGIVTIYYGIKSGNHKGRSRT